MSVTEIKAKGKLIAKSKINGDFTGFDTEALFPLCNGQYWLQNQYALWYYYDYMAPVSIYLYGRTYYLIVDKQFKYVAVKKLERVIENSIINGFKGWTGSTIFHLANGQIWKQDEYSFYSSSAYKPKVIIYNDGFDTIMLVNHKRVKVRRIL